MPSENSPAGWVGLALQYIFDTRACRCALLVSSLNFTNLENMKINVNLSKAAIILAHIDTWCDEQH